MRTACKLESSSAFVYVVGSSTCINWLGPWYLHLCMADTIFMTVLILSAAALIHEPHACHNTCCASQWSWAPSRLGRLFQSLLCGEGYQGGCLTGGPHRFCTSCHYACHHHEWHLQSDVHRPETVPAIDYHFNLKVTALCVSIDCLSACMRLHHANVKSVKQDNWCKKWATVANGILDLPPARVLGINFTEISVIVRT